MDITPASASYAKIVWKSSNSKVATVDQNGVVTFKKKSGGKSIVITAKVVDESGETIKKATFKLKSMKGIVKKITIKGAKSIKAGKGKEVKIKIWPGGEIL